MGITGSSHVRAGFDPSTDIPDLTGRVAIVTGANAGIGFNTVLHLARRGAKVYLGARNEAKAKAALSRLQREGLGPLNGEVLWLKLDLSDPREARKAAEWFLEKEERLDILGDALLHLILDKSVLMQSLLLPLMQETAKLPRTDVRIVNLTSSAHKWLVNPRFDSLASWNNTFADSWFPKMMVYAYSKLANVLWTKELQRRLRASDSPIICTAVHPGHVLSERNMTRVSAWPLGSYIVGLSALANDTPFFGAYTSVFAAASPIVRDEAGKWEGGYVVPYGRLEECGPEGAREDLARELWETTEKILDGIS
ncbi:NAD P-binding protein [Gloeophyllum trabeum ATCC 11539]|uniref:NAD P-binding protein n=1 Tax=Gloeophyllum trabeum (strain ATCC 11539 / FP-39264 / Madison 617) TaxID=670483 RepID=S7RGQ1_GLOTA|nr:NAD P-binding protein [Gloeophyllum trabeum ATCC 11539]EPQ51744.1 NAD P-binding protein [Gloeophyllum trabeum ATCC 11539]